MGKTNEIIMLYFEKGKAVATLPEVIGVGSEISGAAITKIEYCRKGYNSGSKGDFPTYAITLNNGVTLLLKEELVTMIALAEVKNERPAEAVVGLPE